MQKKLVLSLVFFIIFENAFIDSKAIVGSNIRMVQENEFSSVACILRNNPRRPAQNNVMCTGTYISVNHILTSEHCVAEAEANSFLINIGSNNLMLGSMNFPIWWMTYQQWAAIFNITLRYIENDIGIIKVTQGEECIVPTVPSQITPNTLLYGLDVVAVGCGISNTGTIPLTKQTVHLNIITSAECLDITTRLRGRTVPIPPHYICSANNPYAQIQQGDSGGPLLFMDTIIAINKGTAPSLNGRFNQYKVNIHLTIDEYLEFINFLLNM